MSGLTKVSMNLTERDIKNTESVLSPGSVSIAITQNNNSRNPIDISHPFSSTHKYF
jgi:hypothetical protein